MEVLICQ